MSADFEVTGQSATALFTLKIHRGDGMALLGMNWKTAKPPDTFVGFGIEYKNRAAPRFSPLKTAWDSRALMARWILISSLHCVHRSRNSAGYTFQEMQTCRVTLPTESHRFS